MVKTGRSKGVILVVKPLENEKKQAILKREVAQIHANAVIRRLSAKNLQEGEKKRLLDLLIQGD